MSRHPEAYPVLMRAGGEASRRAYDHAPVTVGGAALMQAVATGRRTVTGAVSISDHPHRFARALELVLHDARARADLAALLASYEPQGSPVGGHQPAGAPPHHPNPPAPPTGRPDASQPPRKAPPVFSLSFDTDNDAFAGDPAPETVRILREAATTIERGSHEAAVYDINGNRVGGFRLIGGGQ